MATLKKKMYISGNSALLCLLINLPEFYKLVSNYIPVKLYDDRGCTSNIGLGMNTIIFFIITLITMGSSNMSQYEKVKNSLYSSLIFFAVFSPSMYFQTSKIVNTLTPKGCPSLQGILLHVFIYFLVLILVMYLPN